MKTGAIEDEDASVRIVSLFDAVMHEEDEQPKRHGSPLWMTTFADMITLLLAFFVLILSFSDLNVNRFKDISGSLQKSQAGFAIACTWQRHHAAGDGGSLRSDCRCAGAGRKPG